MTKTLSLFSLFFFSISFLNSQVESKFHGFYTTESEAFSGQIDLYESSLEEGIEITTFHFQNHDDGSSFTGTANFDPASKRYHVKDEREVLFSFVINQNSKGHYELHLKTNNGIEAVLLKSLEALIEEDVPEGIVETNWNDPFWLKEMRGEFESAQNSIRYAGQNGSFMSIEIENYEEWSKDNSSFILKEKNPSAEPPYQVRMAIICSELAPIRFTQFVQIESQIDGVVILKPIEGNGLGYYVEMKLTDENLEVKFQPESKNFNYLKEQDCANMKLERVR